MKLSPEEIVLGDTTEALLQLEIRDANDAAVENCGVSLHVNVGILGEASEVDTGVFTARYTAPTEIHPQFAIFLAHVSGCAQSVISHSVVPLWGQGQVLITAEPNKPVTLSIKDKTFGPAMTDPNGEALVEVRVPPGVAAFNVANKVFDLNVPPPNQVAIISDRRSMRTRTAGIQGSAVLWILAIDSNGAPFEDAPLQLEGARGNLSVPEQVEPGLYKAFYTPPFDLGEDEKDIVQVRLEGHLNSLDELDFQLSSGAPASIEMFSPTTSYMAGSDQKATLGIEVFDADGNPAVGGIAVTSDFGKVSILDDANIGRHLVRLSIPDSFNGRDSLTVTVTVGADAGTLITSEISFDLVSGAPDVIEIGKISGGPFSPEVDDLVALRFIVKDSYGNPVSGAPGVSASLGEVRDLRELSPGKYVIHYIVPPLPIYNQDVKNDLVTVRQGNITAKTSVDLDPKDYVIAATPSVGYLTNFKRLNVPYFRLQSDVSLWFVLRGLSVHLELGYFFNTDQYGGEIKSRTHVLPLLVGFQYRFGVHRVVQLFAGLEAGVELAYFNIDYRGQMSSSERDARFALCFEMGAHFKLGPGSVFASIGYLFATRLDMERLEGRLGGLQIGAGYRFSFF